MSLAIQRERIAPLQITYLQKTNNTEKSAANFFTPLSQKKPDPISWRIVDKTLVVGKYTSDAKTKPASTENKQRIAAFDLVSSGK